MTDAEPAATLIHAQQIDGQPGRQRIVAMTADNALVVAVRDAGADRAEIELDFSLTDAIHTAQLALGGSERARTIPGLSRILCAAIIALSRAALQAETIEIDKGGIDGGETDGGDADEAGNPEHA